MRFENSKLRGAFLEAGLSDPKMELNAPVGGGPRWGGYGFAAGTLRSLECSRLLAFDEVRVGWLAHNRRYLGLRNVEVSKIVGSVGRYDAFDRAFMPTKASVAKRWKRVDRAFYSGLDLPPVRLHKIGDAYFVEDGNNRVSVARYQGVETIEAEVTEFFPL